MKRFFLFCLTAFAVMATGQRADAQAAKTFFVPESERNFAQKLGGYSELDYLWNGPSLDFNKKAGKALIEEYVYHSYDEAFEKLPTIPDISEIDTREKLSDWLNKVRAADWALERQEPREDVQAGKKRLADAMMDNAKRAAKGQPYDTVLHFDPKAKQYDAVLKKIRVYTDPAYKESQNSISPFSQSDPGYKDFLLTFQLVGANKTVFNEFAPLRKQLCHEWFASSACKKIAQMDAPLVERAKEEGVKRTPDWFIEGRKAELEFVEAYNQQVLKRWIQKVKPHLEKERAIIPKVIAYLREVEAVRGDDEMTNEYVSAQLQADSSVELFFRRYYDWLEFIGSAPLVRTPPTLEGKKFTKIDTPFFH